MGLLANLALVITIIFTVVSSSRAIANHFDDSYRYLGGHLRLRSPTVHLDHTILSVPVGDGQYYRINIIPNLSYFTEQKENNPLYEIRNGAQIYKNNELVCSYSSEDGTFKVKESSITQSDDVSSTKTLSQKCDKTMLLFGGIVGSHFHTHGFWGETQNLFYLILDRFDGEWGRMDGALEGGEPLYVHVLEEERSRFALDLSRNDAPIAARALIPNFDKYLQDYLTCLRDINSECSTKLKRAMVGPSLEELKEMTPRALKALNSRPIRGERMSPQVSDETIQEILETRLPLVRAELIGYLERGGVNNQEHHYASYSRIQNPRGRENRDRFEYGFYLKEIDTIVAILMTDKGVELNAKETGTYLAPVMENEEEDYHMAERRIFAAELIQASRLGREVGYHSSSADDFAYNNYLFLRRYAHDQELREIYAQARNYPENMKRRNVISRPKAKAKDQQKGEVAEPRPAPPEVPRYLRRR